MQERQQFSKSMCITTRHSGSAMCAALLMVVMLGGPVNAGERTSLPVGADPNGSINSLAEEDRNYGWKMIGADKADERGLTGRDIKVGVIDTGIAQRLDGTVHPEFGDKNSNRIDTKSKQFLHWVNPLTTTVTDLPDKSDPTYQEKYDAARLFHFDQSFNKGFHDIGGHGSHVSGIIAAGKNDFGMIGVAPQSTIVSVNAVVATQNKVISQGQVCGVALLEDDCKPLYNSDETPPIAAINYLGGLSDVKIVNGSYGPAAEADDKNWIVGDNDFKEANALRNAVNNGVIFVFAAGNDFTDAPILAENPTGNALIPFVSTVNDQQRNSSGSVIFSATETNYDYSDLQPSALANQEIIDGKQRGRVLSVVAVDAYGNIASYSNRCGVAADWCIAAPGGDSSNQRSIYSTVPENLGTAETAGAAYSYDHYPGTSMAAPHVSGALAVLMEAYPGFSPGKLVDVIFMTADKAGDYSKKSLYGHGFLRLDNALNGPVGIKTTDNDAHEFKTDDEQKWVFSFQSKGSLTKTGSASLTIEADAEVQFDDKIAVSQGLLTVNGTLKSDQSFVDIISGGTLGGSGTVDGSLFTSQRGVVAPGNSIGTLTVKGDKTFDAGSVYEAEVAKDGRSDLIKVTGKTTINGGEVELLFTDTESEYKNDSKYTILTSDGGVTGTFDSLYEDSALIDAYLSYGASDVLVTLSVGSFTGTGTTANQNRLASSLDSADFTDDPDVRIGLLNLNSNDLQKAYDDIGNESHASGQAAASSSANQFSNSLQGRASGTGGQSFALMTDRDDDSRQISELAAFYSAKGLETSYGAAPAEGGSNSITEAILKASSGTSRSNYLGGFRQPVGWISGFGAYSIVDGDSNASGFNTHTFGLSAGLESNNGNDLISGMGVGYSNAFTRMSDRSQSLIMDSYHVGLYTSSNYAIHAEGFAWRIGGGFAYHQVESDRSIVFGTVNRLAEASYNAYTWAASAELQYRQPISDQLDRVYWAPLLRVDASHTHTEGFTETGAASLNLTTAAQDYNQLWIGAGASVLGEFNLGGYEIRSSTTVAYERNFGDAQASVTSSTTASGTTFNSTGPDESRDRLKFSYLADIKLTDRSALSLASDLTLSSDRSDVSGKVTFKVAF